MKMYILCTITGTWKPRLLAKAWKGTKSDHQPALASGPPPPPAHTPAHLHLGGVRDTPEDRVIGMQSCRTEAG